MKASLFNSTLSLAFAICVLAVLVMIFMNITPDQNLLGVITGVIAAYLTARNPNTALQASTTTSEDGDKTTTITTIPDDVSPVKTKK